MEKLIRRRKSEMERSSRGKISFLFVRSSSREGTLVDQIFRKRRFDIINNILAIDINPDEVAETEAHVAQARVSTTIHLAEPTALDVAADLCILLHPWPHSRRLSHPSIGRPNSQEPRSLSHE